jgi:hypothetical protein
MEKKSISRDPGDGSRASPISRSLGVAEAEEVAEEAPTMR